MKALRWINTGAFVLMIVVNALAELVPLGGMTTGQVSEAYPNLFTPAPITFAIWGLIYLLMMLFVVYQHDILEDSIHSAEISEQIGIWFSVSCLLNIIWIFLWHYRLIFPSTICIALLLVSLGMIMRRIDFSNGSFIKKLAVNAGFSVYYGWIIAATIANVSVCLTAWGWNGWGISADIWTIIVLLIGAVIAGAVALKGKNRIAALAVMWAYAGILIKHISPAYYAGAHPFVIAAAFVGEGIILAAILLPPFIRRYGNRISSACRAQKNRMNERTE